MIVKDGDGILHVAGDEVKTLILGLCCLEYFWEDHPDVVKALAKQKGDPDLARFAANAGTLRRAMMAKGGG